MKVCEKRREKILERRFWNRSRTTKKKKKRKKRRRKKGGGNREKKKVEDSGGIFWLFVKSVKSIPRGLVNPALRVPLPRGGGGGGLALRLLFRR